MVTILGCSPHPPTCVWVGWVFIYFRLVVVVACVFWCVSDSFGVGVCVVGVLLLRYLGTLGFIIA